MRYRLYQKSCNHVFSENHYISTFHYFFRICSWRPRPRPRPRRWWTWWCSCLDWWYLSLLPIQSLTDVFFIATFKEFIGKNDLSLIEFYARKLLSLDWHVLTFFSMVWSLQSNPFLTSISSSCSSSFYSPWNLNMKLLPQNYWKRYLVLNQPLIQQPFSPRFLLQKWTVPLKKKLVKLMESKDFLLLKSLEIQTLLITKDSVLLLPL